MQPVLDDTQPEHDLCSSLAAIRLNKSSHSHEQPSRPRTVLGDVTNTWQPTSTWNNHVGAQPRAEQWCNQLPQQQLPSNFMHDASFAAYDQQYQMQLPTPSHAYQSCRSDQQVCQSSIAPPFRGSMQHVPYVDSLPEHASSGSKPWQRGEGGMSSSTSASVPNSNSLLPPAPTSFNIQSQHYLDDHRCQQLNAEADVQHSSAQHKPADQLQQTAQVPPQHQLVSSHKSLCNLQYQQSVMDAPSAAASSNQWANAQPMAPVRTVAAPHGSASRRLQARRTIYVCDIDSKVKEVNLANLFMPCGKIVDCRLCCDPNSALRFAFIEFDSEAAVDQALLVNGMQLGNGAVRVTRSRTAMNPVKQEFLPRSYEERERCGRTVYVANVDERLEAADVRRFFSKFCGQISAMRLLRSTKVPTQIAFVEFADAQSASAALDWSGSLLGSMQIRVAPSKTPIRRVE